MPYLPLTEFSLGDAEGLKIGDFAILPEYNNERLMVVETPDGPIAVFIANPTMEWGSSRLSDISGAALIIENASIEVDPMSARPDENVSLSPGSIFAHKGKLNFVANHGGRGTIALTIGQYASEPVTYRKIVFDRWRVVKRIGDETAVLFEGDRSKS